MKFLRLYSTAEKNKELGDTIINTEEERLQIIKGIFDTDINQFMLAIMTSSGGFYEAHDTVKKTRERVKIILMAYGGTEADALQLSTDIRFLRKPI